MADYPRTTNIEKWEIYLGRDLEQFEYIILKNVGAEKYFNQKLLNLYNNCKKYDTYIPILSNLHGDCLFECLIYNGLGEDINSLRKSLSYLLYQYKDFKNFFDGRDDTLNEIFTITNDIEYVYNSDDDKLYKYTYNIMCEDLVNDHSWDNLPSHLLLLFISRLFNIEFFIISDVFDQPTIIHAYENSENKPELTKVYLGHIFENHYVPVTVIDENYNEDKYLTYFDAKRVFHHWGTTMANMKNI